MKLTALYENFNWEKAGLVATIPAVIGAATLGLSGHKDLPNTSGPRSPDLVKAAQPKLDVQIGLPQEKGPEIKPKPNYGVFAKPIAWGSTVSSEFKQRVVVMSDYLGIEPDWLMACMAFETMETFDPAARNMAGSSGTGLIQFMNSTARQLGTTTEKLAKMTELQQLHYVHKYLVPHTKHMHSLEDVYMAILYPAAVGKPNKFVLFRKGTLAYSQNRGLDTQRKGYITKGDAAAKVRQKLLKGLGEGYKG